MGTDEGREFLDTLLRPSLGTTEELSGMLLLEVINRLLKFDLRGA